MENLIRPISTAIRKQHFQHTTEQEVVKIDACYRLPSLFDVF